MFKSKKGQIALEILVIFGVLVVGSIIFGLFYMNNIKDILVEGPGTKQDKNGGGDVYDDLEGSLIYNEEQQIGSSSHGITGGSGGSGGTGGTDDPEDPVPYCGDGSCNYGETYLTCPQDCAAGFQSIDLSLIPIGGSLINQDFGIYISIQTNSSESYFVKKLNVFDEFGNPSNNCNYNGESAAEFLNLGELYTEGTNKVSNTFTFSCDTIGTYSFDFVLALTEDPTQELAPAQINKNIIELNYQAVILSPIVPDGNPFEYKDVHIPMYWLAKVTDSLGNDLTDSYVYTWAVDWPEYGIIYNGDFDNDLMQIYSDNGVWYDGSISSGEYNLYVKASDGTNEIVSEGIPIISLGGMIIMPRYLQSPVINSVYSNADSVRLNTGLKNSDILDYSNVSCNWYYHNLDTGTVREIALDSDCLSNINYPTSDLGSGIVLIYVQLNAEDRAGNPVRDTRMSKIIIN
jgi:hypothetical protein